MDLLSNYKYLGFIILPQNEEQLVEQVKISNRTERLESILQEYRSYYARYHNQEQGSVSDIPIINVPHKLNETSKLIHSLSTSFNT
jgi:hypothetical protein